MLKLALVITDAVTVICTLGLAFLVGNYAEKHANHCVSDIARVPYLSLFLVVTMTGIPTRANRVHFTLAAYSATAVRHSSPDCRRWCRGHLHAFKSDARGSIACLSRSSA